MIGPLEIVIILVIIGIVFAGYFRKRLPEFGRKAGESARVGSEKAKELAAQTGEKAGDKWDSQTIGRKAGEGFREAREIRDSFKGALDSPAPAEAKPAEAAGAAPPADDPEPDAPADDPEPDAPADDPEPDDESKA